jgi:hypothetical protein
VKPDLPDLTETVPTIQDLLDAAHQHTGIPDDKSTFTPCERRQIIGVFVALGGTRLRYAAPALADYFGVSKQLLYADLNVFDHKPLTYSERTMLML